jgi:hypothetical protein
MGLAWAYKVANNTRRKFDCKISDLNVGEIIILTSDEHCTICWIKARGRHIVPIVIVRWMMNLGTTFHLAFGHFKWACPAWSNYPVCHSPAPMRMQLGSWGGWLTARLLNCGTFVRETNFIHRIREWPTPLNVTL